MSTIVGVTSRPAFEPSVMVVLSQECDPRRKASVYKLVFHSPACEELANMLLALAGVPYEY